MEPAWNTKIWVKIISAYEVQHNQVFVAEGSRGEEGGRVGWQKTQEYAFSGHERIEARSDDGKALKILRQEPITLNT